MFMALSPPPFPAPSQRALYPAAARDESNYTGPVRHDRVTAADSKVTTGMRGRSELRIARGERMARNIASITAAVLLSSVGIIAPTIGWAQSTDRLDNLRPGAALGDSGATSGQLGGDDGSSLFDRRGLGTFKGDQLGGMSGRGLGTMTGRGLGTMTGGGLGMPGGQGLGGLSGPEPLRSSPAPRRNGSLR